MAIKFSFWKTLLFWIGILVSGQSLAKDYFFSGTVGKYPVYMSLDIENETVSAFYFYKNKLIDIYLVGKMKGSVLYLTTDFGLEDQSEVFKLTWNSKKCNGTWTKGGKTLKVNLTAVPDSDPKNSRCERNTFIRDNHYPLVSRAKIELFQLKALDSTRTVSGKLIRYFEEVHTGMILFRVDDGYTNEELMRMNQFLEALHVSYFLSALECSSYSETPIYFDISARHIHFNPEWMCFAVTGSYYCGGAHPDEFSDVVNFSIISGKNHKLEDFITDQTIANDTNLNSKFNELVLNYFGEKHPELFNVTEESKNDPGIALDLECEYNRPELWSFEYLQGVATPTGFYLIPGFEHFRSYCNWPDWSFIPYSQLESLIKPEFKSITEW